MVFKKLFRFLRRTFKIKRKKRIYKKTHRKKRYQLKRRSLKKTIRRQRPFSHKKKKRIIPKKKKISRKRNKVGRVPKAKNKIEAKVIGKITHYFPKVNAAVVVVKRPVEIGEPIWIKGSKTDFKQTVGSMQIDRVAIEKARAGQEIGLEVFREVRPGDVVYVLAKKG